MCVNDGDAGLVGVSEVTLRSVGTSVLYYDLRCDTTIRSNYFTTLSVNQSKPYFKMPYRKLAPLRVREVTIQDYSLGCVFDHPVEPEADYCDCCHVMKKVQNLETER